MNAGLTVPAGVTVVLNHGEGLNTDFRSSGVTVNTGLPPTSPYVIQFGQDGSVFEVTIRFDETTRGLISVRLTRSQDASGSTLLINDVEVGTVTRGGALTLSASKLASFGLDTFGDIVSVGLRD